MRVSKMVEAEIWTIARVEDGTAVLLRPLGAEIAVPIFIGESEAQTILLGLGPNPGSRDLRSAVPVPRPLTHDLLLDLIKKDGLTLYRAEVHDLHDSIFYARLLLTGREFSKKHPLTLDARPSDALALAVRCKCPVFIAQKVTDQAGLPTEFFLDVIGKDRANSADNRGVEQSNGIEREVLQIELDQAVAGEEYERAAKIRDVLALLDKE
jgi:bifunctional DNase/RNase